MESNVKIAIGLGIVVAAFYYMKKGSPAETTTENTGGGGGGGGGGGIGFPSAPTPPTPPAATKPTTTTPPSNVSNALKKATVIQQAGTKPNIPNPMGGGGVANVPVNTGTSQYTQTWTKVTCVDGKTYTVSDDDIKAAGGQANWCKQNGHVVSNKISVKCANNKTYSVSPVDITASGGQSSWCNRNGHYAGSSNFVGFDGKITRPAFKVDFF
jgi:hypothetical protein